MMFSAEELFSLSAFVLVLGALLGFAASAGLAVRRLAWASRAAALVAVAVQAAGFALRWHYYATHMDAGILRAFPVSNFYESVIFCVFAVLAVCLVQQRRMAAPALWGLVELLGAGMVLALSLTAVPSKPTLFLPSLKNYWLLAHVTLSFAAYAMFFVSASVSLWALLRGQCQQSAPLVRSLLALGIFVFSIGGILFGAIWAQNSWGRFWGWDPKETWALISWCVYLVILHLDRTRCLSDRSLCWAALLAFAVILFTFLGINVLFGGLHSYASLA